MAKQAIILRCGSPAGRELRLGRILDFFGVPWEIFDVSELADLEEGAPDRVVFGTAQAVAAAVKKSQGTNNAAQQQTTFYAYLDDDRAAGNRAFQELSGHADFSLHEAPDNDVPLRVSGEPADLAGPMAGLKTTLRLRAEDAIVVGPADRPESRFETILTAGNAPVFARLQPKGATVFFCASSYMVDIEQAVGSGFYDIKDHFCSAVPLVMFIRYIFAGVAWRPQELSACLIIDDPLLRRRYGHCDFAMLRDLMRSHEFTTNIAFIPWNWRRTSPSASDFFKDESEHFSVSIHGCDHVAGEFGATSPGVLDSKASLALARMRNHKTRTGVQHDPIMVFPQGVFSSASLEVLKQNGFLAAVNTETVPVDLQNARTRIRDVWDVAITRYSGFPIFTRRYAFHGLENFAFDLLLGKPCLIVAHHDFFKDGAARLVELIGRLRSLNCNLRWRPLGGVIRRACRLRASAAGVEEVEMYGNELLLDNPSEQPIEARIRKRENQSSLVARILCDETAISWKANDDHILFGARIQTNSHRQFKVVYQEKAEATEVGRPLRYELSVTSRRILSEFRDDYLSRRPFLNTTATRIRRVFTKAN